MVHSDGAETAPTVLPNEAHGHRRRAHRFPAVVLIRSRDVPRVRQIISETGERGGRGDR